MRTKKTRREKGKKQRINHFNASRHWIQLERRGIFQFCCFFSRFVGSYRLHPWQYAATVISWKCYEFLVFAKSIINVTFSPTEMHNLIPYSHSNITNKKNLQNSYILSKVFEWMCFVSHCEWKIKFPYQMIDSMNRNGMPN